MDICVGGSRSCTCQERHANDMLTSTCWRAKYGKTVRRIFASWFGAYCIYIYMLFLIWCKYQEALCKFSWPFFVFCLVVVVVQVNTANNIQYLWLFLDIQIKYSWNPIIQYPFCTSVLITILLFVATTTKNIGLFFIFVGI